jgi:cob(I)alamin adenosyltransferase
MIHIYTGDGKGKTTCALGIALRFLGWKKRVCVLQFLKSKNFVYGETISAKKFGDRFKIIKFKDQIHPIFIKGKTPKSYFKIKESIKRGLEIAKRIIQSKKFDLVILDEIINTVREGFIHEKEIFSLLEILPKETELILTGRGATKGLIKRADYVTLMRNIKHPYQKGILARKGVEF